ncbi:MAG: hypothetical protein K8L97_11295 [Anaerolineae bacterium]|nr:hypothetical protein [Anaerolineae bacterium]
MAKQKRNPLQNIGSRLREILEDMERLLNPQPPKRVPVPVPVRVPRSRSPYGR